jgi:tripartite ATP-independent periplasmic transporter solute receptor, DctP family
MKLIKNAGIIFLMLLLLTGCIKDRNKDTEPELILRYADNQPDYYPTAQAAEYFASLVKEKTDGRIEIEVFANGELGDEQSTLEQIRFGGIDFSRFSLGSLSALYPVYSVLQLPFLYRDEEHMWKVLDSELGDALLKASEEKDLYGLCWFDAGARSFYSRIPIRNTAGLAGLRIRVQESDLMSRMIELVGATPVQMAYGDVYSALKLGLIDGAENNEPSYISKEHYQVAPFVFQDEHFRVPEIMLMSQNARNRIAAVDSSYPGVISECAKEASLRERELWKKAEENAKSTMAEKGCIIYEADEAEKKKLRELMSPIYDEFSAEFGSLIESIETF